MKLDNLWLEALLFLIEADFLNSIENVKIFPLKETEIGLILVNNTFLF
jgi:hypothetical protein